MAEDKNTYSTYAVKLDGEVKEELQALLEGYKAGTDGANAGDFIKTLLEVYKTNKIVNKASGTDADIKELNTLTNRMYSIYSNLIERNNNNNSALQLEFSEQLSQKDNSINNLKAKLQEKEQENEILKDAFNNAVAEKTELEKENNQLQKLNDSLELNISKLQEDTNSLHELKEVNNKLLSEKEELNKLLATQQADNIEKANSIKAKDFTIEKLTNDIEVLKQEHEKVINELKVKHNAEFETLKEKAEIQKEKEIVELKSKHQEELQMEKDKYNNKISEYQNKHESLLKDMEKSKQNTHNKRPAGEGISKGGTK